jgi:hypothetical protein
MTRSSVSPWAVRGLYLFSLVLVTSPLIDLVSTAWPLRPTDLSWRYGFIGLGAGYLSTPILGLVLAAAVAYWQGDAGALRTLGILSAVVAVAMLPLLAMWPLDFLQMRGLRAEETRRGILVGGVIQEIKYLGACFVLALLGAGALGTAKGSGGRGGAPESPGIVSRGR